MRQLQEEELSALLDGELDAHRAEEVRALIAADPALRVQYNALVQLDARLAGSAEQMGFVPDISFPVASRRQVPGLQLPAVIAVTLALIIVRLAPKLVELLWFGIGVQFAVCALIAVILVRMARETALSFDKGSTDRDGFTA